MAVPAPIAIGKRGCAVAAKVHHRTTQLVAGHNRSLLRRPAGMAPLPTSRADEFDLG